MKHSCSLTSDWLSVCLYCRMVDAWHEYVVWEARQLCCASRIFRNREVAEPAVGNVSRFRLYLTVCLKLLDRLIPEVIYSAVVRALNDCRNVATDDSMLGVFHQQNTTATAFSLKVCWPHFTSVLGTQVQAHQEISMGKPFVAIPGLAPTCLEWSTAANRIRELASTETETLKKHFGSLERYCILFQIQLRSKDLFPIVSFK